VEAKKLQFPDEGDACRSGGAIDSINNNE